jgi:hypothetical protein
MVTDLQYVKIRLSLAEIREFADDPVKKFVKVFQNTISFKSLTIYYEQTMKIGIKGEVVALNLNFQTNVMIF